VGFSSVLWSRSIPCLGGVGDGEGGG